MANLKYGSSGEDVKKLQEALGFTGADVDGQFGPKTQQAVKDYQRNNGLSVDGIVGDETWGSLTKANSGASSNASTSAPSTTPTTTPTTESTGFNYGNFSYADFAPSDIVNQANSLIQQQQANKPGSYTSVWQDEADAYLSQYQNRDPFSYDPNADALYNQYKEDYIRQGQLAMMDTMGQAAALTGGYGNSYAQRVGQQAYNQQLSQLNNIVPELAQMAHDRYTQEGQDLLAMYDLYMGRDAQDYSKYQDNVDAWYREMDRLTDNYNTLYNREWEDYVSKKSTAYDEYLLDRQEKRDDYLNKLEMDLKAAEIAASAGQYDRLQDVYGLTDDEVAAIKKSNTPKSTGGGTTPKQVKYETLDYDEQAKWTKEFSKATSLSEVAWVADRMQSAGVDPQVVGSWYNNYAQNFIEEPEDPKKDPWIPVQEERRTGHGGGGHKSVEIGRISNY